MRKIPTLGAGRAVGVREVLRRGPEGVHRLVPHATAEEFADVPRDFDRLRAWLRAHPEFEGVVWHHPDGRTARLKHRDAVASG